MEHVVDHGLVWPPMFELICKKLTELDHIDLHLLIRQEVKISRNE